MLYLFNFFQIEKARELFKEIHGYVFQFEHCWLILKDFPKWASTMPKEDSRKEMPQTPDSINQGEGVDGIMDFERPIGRKAEKVNRKRKDDGKDIVIEYLKKKMKILEEGCAAKIKESMYQSGKGSLARVERE